jgi:predicted acyltransferase
VAAPGIAPASGRLKAIDVFRGAAIVGMILVNAQGSREDAYSQFVHAAWNGLTFADTIYPCFLFLVGVALTLSTASRINRGEERGQLLLHAVRRSVLLLACGVLIDNLLFRIGNSPFLPSATTCSSPGSCRGSRFATWRRSSSTSTAAVER